MPTCFFELVRNCEANSEVLENMTVRRPFYNVEEALERIWKDSGKERFIGKPKVEPYVLLSEDQNDDS